MATIQQVQAKTIELIEKYETNNGVLADLKPEQEQEIRIKLTLRAKQLVKQEERAAHVKTLINFAQTYASSEDNPEVLVAVKGLTTKAKATRSVNVKNGHVTPRGVIADLFVNIGDKASESDIFSKFRMGRGDMKAAIKVALQKAETSERKWVAFDFYAETYILLDIGPNAPNGWAGYMPLAEAPGTAS